MFHNTESSKVKNIIIDLANCFFRCRHIAPRSSDTEERVAFAVHVTLSSINSVWKQQRGDVLVICLEGRSWRKDFYKPYKANRAVARAAQTDEEMIEDKAFWKAFDDLCEFFRSGTNSTVLQNPVLEADDLIAAWIDHHPDQEHVIVSTDTDFVQLLAKNVSQYNGVTEELITLDGVFNRKGQQVIDKKTQQPKHLGDPAYYLFRKCVKGDSTDNVFSAYPGVREKGSRNRVGILEAYADREKQGFSWSNLMLQRWSDADGAEHRVLDDYQRNRVLIDLRAQPSDIRDIMHSTVTEAAQTKTVGQVGVKFLKFCGKYRLEKLSQTADAFAQMFNASYK
jgi:5'-3' exonuclease